MKITIKENEQQYQNINKGVPLEVIRPSSPHIKKFDTNLFNTAEKTYNFMINGLKKIQKTFSKQIKKYKKKLEKESKIFKKSVDKNIRKEINYYLEKRFKKLEKNGCSYRYLLSHLYPEKQLDYLSMQVLGLLDIHNKLKPSKIKIKKLKHKKTIKKILKFYNEELIMYEFIKYLRKKYKIKD